MVGGSYLTPAYGSLANVKRYFPHVLKSKNEVSQQSPSPQGGPVSSKRKRTVSHSEASPNSKTSNHIGSPMNPVDLLEDDDDPQTTIKEAYVSSHNDDSRSPHLSNRNNSVIDLTIDDYMTDAQLRAYVRRLSIQEEKDEQARLSRRTNISVHSNQHPRFKCAAGKCVELKDGSFLRITRVQKDVAGKIFVAGDHLVRQNFMGLTMSKRRNEVVLEHQPAVPGLDRATHEVSIEEVLRNRHIIFTNQPFPTVSSRDDQASFSDPTQQVEHGPLFCRWVHTTVLDTRRRSIEQIIEHLDPAGANDTIRVANDGHTRQTRISTVEARYLWRGIDTTLGGSNTSRSRTFDLNGRATVEQVQSYTFGDAFCGAGGTSRGAVDAGLKLLWGFDNNLEAIETYKTNFARCGADCRLESVNEFLSRLMKLYDLSGVRVDVLHISPPCQPFSPAHTIPSPERDEMNQAALPSVWQLVETLKPRIVTIEETEGLFSRHKEWFSLLINTFTTLGYSVRWKVVQCNEYGVPQTRKRLLVVAAGPGEKLPPFPEPTHGAADTGLKPLATINSAMSNIPHNALNHDQSIRFENGRRPPLDGNVQAKTITTNAGQGNYHPSGLRPYTLRELARLQTFPLYHSFAGAKGVTEARRQIGNAVPPVLAKAMFRAIVKSLKESDGV
ncbi:uncharacterized protein HMPREF1541_04484 [Cyphellophora europaea CBS 101466]|uniref:DNA (cytosine-5-)-methyltransferase n=1 Tax=Cyphellophora europaea (strain CBS 101466) TaxID=1220924 RepID=W2RWP7_CYPE1|nr:uncharacterized protein HMPREF1541_04484 [Cyphellophora europaea CBS 101466]ETN40208.1 hypothetical protein HMPREF1541_04484 [Cyphellophora europaea CBS 101466]